MMDNYEYNITYILLVHRTIIYNVQVMEIVWCRMCVSECIVWSQNHIEVFLKDAIVVQNLQH